ncbi:MAG TPA: glycosyltransferase family 4 protein [Trebonia sp.]|nr:glycosyltransferase family 4 protein [Trebonia sp.]
MRIAQVVASYHPRIGGVETHVRRIAEGCAVAGDDVTVLTHQAPGQPAEETIGPVRVLRFQLTLRSQVYPFSWRLFRYLGQHAAEYDVVHAHSYHTLAGQAAPRAGLPFVFTPHYHGTGHTPFAAALHRVYRPFGGRLFTSADAVICVSSAERALIVRDFPQTASKVTVIPNGTQARVTAARAADTTAGTRRLVLTIGRLERYKNTDLVIRAFRALPFRAELVIVGDGADRARLEEIARSGEPGHPVRFTGEIPDDELDALLATATVVTSASHHEAFGLILADGLTAGARVVASAIPAHREVGMLAGPAAPVTFVEPGDTAEFTAALAGALDAGRVPAGSVSIPSWSDVAGRTRDVYARVTAGGHARRRELV